MSKDHEKHPVPPTPTESTSLATKEPTADEMMAAVLSGQGGIDTGFGDMRSQDFVMPMLRILQVSSPEMKPANAKYILAAKVGQLLDTSTGELMDSCQVIPCLFQARMVEWKVDEKGQAEQFVATHDSNFGSTLPSDDRFRKMLPNGNRLVDTRYHYVLRMRGEEFIPNIIAMSSSAIKVSKDWNTKMDSQRIPNTVPGALPVKPPVYMNVCQLGPTTDEHKGKYDWKGWKVSLLRLLTVKESDKLKSAMLARQNFQESSANMKPVAEQEPEYVAPDPSENKHL